MRVFGSQAFRLCVASVVGCVRCSLKFAFDVPIVCCLWPSSGVLRCLVRCSCLLSIVALFCVLCVACYDLGCCTLCVSCVVSC